MKNIIQIILVTGSVLFSLDAMAENGLERRPVAQTLAETIADCDSTFKFAKNEFMNDINKNNVINKYCTQDLTTGNPKIINRCAKKRLVNGSLKVTKSNMNEDFKYGFYVNCTIDLSELSIKQADALDFTGSIFHGVTIKPPSEQGFVNGKFQTKSTDICSCDVSSSKELDPSKSVDMRIGNIEKKCAANVSDLAIRNVANDIKRLFRPSSPSNTGSPPPGTTR